MTDTPKTHPFIEAIRSALAEHIPTFQSARTGATAAMLEQFEADIAPLVAPIAQRLLDNPTTADELRPLLGVLTGPQHFGESVVIGIAIGSLIAPVLNAGIAPVVQTLANEAWQTAINSDSSAGGVPLSPEQVATALLKGFNSPGGLFTLSNDPQTEAARSGIDADRLNDLYHIAGQSFGLELALLLLRRGQITSEQFTTVLQYSNINPAFYDMVLAGEYLPPSVGEVLSAARRGWLDPGTAQTYLGHAGIDPTVNWAWLYDAAGAALSLGEMFNLYNRNIVGMPDVQTAAQRHGLHPDYWQYLPPLAVHFPAVYQVVELVKDGAMTAERAATILGYEGFEQVDIDSITGQVNGTATAKVKELSYGQIVRAYEEQLITAAEATTRLTALKYDAPTITLILELADNERAFALQQATIRKIGSQYVAHKLDVGTATSELTKAGVPQSAITTLFNFWDIEQAANVHVPTTTMIVGAYRRGVISAGDCKARLVALGVSATDLPIVVADGYPPTKPEDAQNAAATISNA